jgi:hypothetical protein
MSDASDGTGAGLLQFLEWAGSRGEIPAATVRSLAVSVRKVLSVEAEPEAVDIRRLHDEDTFGRFEVLHRTDYSTQSLAAYRSRFMNSVAMYRAWLDKQPDWKTAGGWNRRKPGTALVRASAGRPAARSTGKPTKAVRKPDPQPQPFDRRLEPESVSSMVPYDLPLRPGLRVRLVLPEILTRADADRIAAFVASLAFEEDAGAPSGG